MERARLGAAAGVLLVFVLAACGQHETTEAPIAPPAGPISWPYGAYPQEPATVRAMAVGDDGTIYVGGTFTRIGPMTGAGVPVNAGDGASLAAFARIDGSVSAAAADGSGGWYVGGGFSRVGGAPRENLAHVLADGSVDLSWNPGASLASPTYPDVASVYALAFDGTTLYVSGSFDTLGGAARAGVGALDASGAPTAWAPAVVPSWGVSAIALRGTTVYLAGQLTSVGGQPRAHLAAVDAASGAPTDWNPGAEGVTASGYVSELAVLGDAVVAAGYFDRLGGEPRFRLGAVDATTGVATAWTPVLSVHGGIALASALAVDGGTLYLGGYFDAVDGEPRSGLAAFDASGALTAWAPALDVPMVTALGVSGGNVYTGGWFRSAGGLARSQLAAFDASGAPTAWDPDADDAGWVMTLAASGSAVYVGGTYRWLGKDTKRSGLAAVDAMGRVTAWNPGVEGTPAAAGTPSTGFGGAVYALAVVGGTVYVGGEFAKVGGAPRANLAAVDASGSVTTWNPSVSGPVFALAWAGDALHVGGNFVAVAAQPRPSLAAVDAGGQVTAWNPRPNGLVTSLAASGTTVYVGGYFTAVAGKRRTALAAVDASGALLPWDPEPSNAIGYASPLGMIGPPPGAWSLAVDGSIVYVAGDFQNVGAVARKHVAAIDAASGAPTAFVNPDLGMVRVIAPFEGSPAEGGTFDSRVVGIGANIAAIVDPTCTETSKSWAEILQSDLDPNLPQPFVQAIAAKDGVLYMGGLFPGGRGTWWERWNLAAWRGLQLTSWNPNAAP